MLQSKKVTHKSAEDEIPYKKFKRFLTGKDLKLTKQRKIILEEVFSIHDHFEIELFIDKLHRDKKSISRGTVYSTIKLLLQAGLIRKINTENKTTKYEHTYGHKHHDHLICTHCGKVIEFYSAVFQKEQEKICKKECFKLHQQTYNLYGLCSECQ